MLLSKVVSNSWSFVFFNSLVKVSARVAAISCITQATLKHHALLTHKRRLLFFNLNFILDLSTCLNWANICVYLPTEVCQLFTYCVCGFLVLVGEHDSNWVFSFISHSGMWMLGNFWFNDSANGWLHKVVRIAQSGEDLFKANKW